MEMMSLAGILRRMRRRGYNRLSSPANRRNVKVVRFGQRHSSSRSWQLKLVPKLRLVRLVSPLRVLRRLKDGYVNMMLGLAGSSNKRNPKGGGTSMGCSRSEFENRLIYEIYKSMVDSFELGYHVRS